MSDIRGQLPRTILRTSYERARGMGLQEQLVECADHLGSPVVLHRDVIDAFRALSSCGMGEIDPGEESVESEPGELVLEDFSPGQTIEVTGEDPFEFRCIATDVMPLVEIESSGPDRDGLDYIADRSEHYANPILAAVQSPSDSSAYAVYLRLLSCFSEVLTPRALARLDEGPMKGLISELPIFDLHLVVWRGEGVPSQEEVALIELTRDLAESVRESLERDAQLPGGIGDIYCLGMDPSGFRGELELLWRV